jgi:hypothetical protein
MESDYTSISWSTYEQERSRIEYETRLKIAEDIQRKVNIVRESGLSRDLFYGLEIAKTIVLDMNTSDNDATEQPTLL